MKESIAIKKNKIFYYLDRIEILEQKQKEGWHDYTRAIEKYKQMIIAVVNSLGGE